MSTQQTVTEEQVYAALKKCMDPEIPVNVVDLGLIYGVKVAGGKDVDIKMTMTTRGCPLHDTLISDVKRYVGKVNGIGNINVDIVWDPPWSLEKMNQDVREKLGFGKPNLRFQIDYEKSKPMKIGRLSMRSPTNSQLSLACQGSRSSKKQFSFCSSCLRLSFSRLNPGEWNILSFFILG